jgi:uroporphyrinogen III methyltransferase / synthase
VTVYFVGAGPGDPRLLTLRAREVLGRAEVVVHDAEVSAEVLAQCAEGARRLVVDEGAAEVLLREAGRGKTVVRLLAGDALLFGPGEAEASALAAAGVAIEIVPGLPAEGVLGSHAGIALTRTSDATPSVAFVRVTAEVLTLHDWAKLATATDTLVLATEPALVAELARTLVFHGRGEATPVALVAHPALPTQRVVASTLDAIGAAVFDGPRVFLVVGEGVDRRGALGWFDRRPLFGKRILVTRARDQAAGAAALLAERGAEPVVLPTIELRPPPDPAPMQRAVAALGDRYDWVAFTSANGVRFLWKEIARQGRDARVFGHAKLCAIGPGTAQALAEHGLTADVVAAEFKGEGLASEMLDRMAHSDAGKRVLVARALKAREVLPEALRSAGCEVDVVPVYETVPPPPEVRNALVAELERGSLDVVTFTSSSTVDNFCELVGTRAPQLLSRVCVASIGPVTSRTAESRGLLVEVMAREYTVPGLIAALERHYRRSN